MSEMPFILDEADVPSQSVSGYLALLAENGRLKAENLRLKVQLESAMAALAWSESENGVGG